MAELNENSRVRRGGDLLEADVDGEIVALSIDKGLCYGMNEVASRVWTLIAEPKSIAELCSTLTEEYAVDPATCRDQVIELLRELRFEGLVEIVA